MKTIGMLGGMSWESSSVYYTLINREVQKRLGGVHSAKALMYSFDFGEVESLQRAAKWAEAGDELASVSVSLKHAGADFLMICCNTMHLVSTVIEKATGIPLLHIADPLGAEIRRRRLRRIGLTGSIHTMERSGILIDRLHEKYDLELIIPEEAERLLLHRIIIEELCRGVFSDSARKACAAVIATLVKKGAEGVILGCTELPLLVKPEDASVPLFDTTTLHAMAAVDLALS